MNEQKSLTPETTHDVLDTHVNNHIALPETEKFGNESFMSEVTSHPNLQSHSIVKLYNHAMEPVKDSPEALNGLAEVSNLGNEQLEHLMNHTNTPADIKKDFALKTFHPDNTHSDIHAYIANSGLIPEQDLISMSDKALASVSEEKNSSRPHAYEHISPDYYLKMFKNRSQQNPEGLEEKEKHKHKKESELAFKGLLTSKKHTPETLDQTIDAITSNKFAVGTNSWRVSPRDDLKEIVSEREDLSKDQLNKIHQWVETNKEPNDHYYSSNDVRDKILEHKNVDPALLAKYATGKDISDEALSHPNLPKESISAFIKKVQNPKDWSESRRIDALLSNPSISKDHVKELIKKGSTKALQHPLAEESDVRDWYAKSDKKLDSARAILSAENTPPDVLKELVNHKNQDIAIQALSHPKADMDVVQEGLKRKAKAVQDEARLHPLVASQQVSEGLNSGKVSLSKVYTDKDYQEHFNKMPKSEQEKVFHAAHEKYQGEDIASIAKKTKERPEHVIHSKFKLASDDRVPASIRQKHSKDLADEFRSEVPKNQQLNIKSKSILSENHEQDSHRLVNAVTALAAHGDKQAQSAILDNPGVLQHIKDHINVNEVPSSFLEDMFSKNKQYEAQGTTVYDYSGRPRTYAESSDLLNNLYNSKNLPDSVFHEIASNKDYMERLGEGNQFNRYNSLPEEEQKVKYREILDSGSIEAAKSILKAKAPTQIWNEAFSRLNDNAKSHFLFNNTDHVKEHRPDIFKNTVLGMYGEGSRRDYDTAQHKAITKLDHNSLEDRNTLKSLISTPEGDQGYISDDVLAKTLPSRMKTQDFDIADHAFSVNRPGLGYKLAIEKFQADTLGVGYQSSYNSKTDNEIVLQRANDTLNNIRQKIAQLPGYYQNYTEPASESTNWSTVLQNSRPEYSGNETFLHKLKKAGANLDFLADFRDQDGDNVRAEALKQNLLSDEKVQSIAQAGTMNDLVNVGSIDQRQKMLAGYLQRPNLNYDDLSLLADKINHSYVNPEARNYKKRSLSEEGYAKFADNVSNIISVYQDKAPNLLGRVVSNLMRPHDKLNDLTNTDKHNIAKALVKQVSEKEYASPIEKNKSLYAVYRGLKASTEAPANLLKTIEKQAFETNDIDTLVDMSAKGDLSDSASVKLSKIAANSDALSAAHIAALSRNLDVYSDPSEVMSSAASFEKKIAKEKQINPKADHAQAKKEFLSNLTKTFVPSTTSDDHKQKNDFVINYNKRAALDPEAAPTANNNLRHISESLSKYDTDKAIDIFASLPDDPSKYDTSGMTSPANAMTALASARFGEEMVNHPKFIESAISGWKLGAFARNARHLDGNNISILTNRVLSSQEAVVNKHVLFSNLEDNKYTKAEDAIKLARSLSENDFNSFLKTGSSSLEGNSIFAAHARLQDLQAVVKDPNLAAPGAPHLGVEHTNKIMYNLHALAHAVGSIKFSDDASKLGEKLTKASEMVDTIHSNIKHVAAAMKKDLQDDKLGLAESAVNREYLLSTAEVLASAKMAYDKKDALKILDIVNTYKDVSKATGSPSDPTKGRDVIKNIVQKTENFESQDWSSIFSQAPEAVYHLSSRENVPTEALSNIDFKSIEDQEDLSHFVRESKEWFPKMSKEDLNHHGKNLMSMYAKAFSDKKITGRHYQEAMSKGLKHLGDTLSNQDIQKLLSQTDDFSIKKNLYDEAVASGVGGVDTLNSYAKDFSDDLFRSVKDLGHYEGHQTAAKLEPILKSPHLTDELSSKVMDMFEENPEVMHTSALFLLNNKNAPKSAVEKLAKTILDNHSEGYKKINQRSSSELASGIMQHPNVSEDQLLKLFQLSNEKYPKYFASSGKFNPALINSTHGGKLFRSMPVAIPEGISNVDQSKVSKSVNLQHKDYKRMKEVMSLIPAEGISWAEFKRKYPDQEKTLPQSIKQIFSAASNKPVMPEAFVNAMRSLDDNSKKYHLTYSHWTSKLQRHNPDSTPNLVVQVNNSEESEKTLSQDPKLWSLYQKLLLSTNGIDNGSIGLHPTTPHLVSWSRVDTDQKGSAWAIEEYQSDFAQKFRKNLRTLIKNHPSGAQINGQTVTAEDMKKYSKAIDKHLSDWTEASMQAVIDNAKAHGLKKLYMHGAELRGYMSGGYSREFWDNENTKEKTVGFRKIYDENPRNFGFKECDYTDYPNHSSEMLNNLHKNKLSTKCWVLDLAPDESPKKGKKKA